MKSLNCNYKEGKGRPRYYDLNLNSFSYLQQNIEKAEMFDIKGFFVSFGQFVQNYLGFQPSSVVRTYYLLSCLLNYYIEEFGNLPKTVICDDDKTLEKK